jgi:hypothetical protein
MRRYLILGALLIAALIAVDEFESMLRQHQSKISSRFMKKPTTASIPAIPFPDTKNLGVKVKGNNPIEVATEYLEEHREEWNLQPYHDFRAVEFHTPLGTKVKFSVYQSDVPIVEMGIQMEIGRDLTVLNVQNKYQPIAKADIDLRGLDAEQILGKNSGRYEADGESKLPPPVLFVRPGSRQPELAYLLSVKDRGLDSRPVQILFRASDGQVLAKTLSRSEF